MSHSMPNSTPKPMPNATPTLSAVITQQTQPVQHNNAVAFCVDNKYLPYALFVAQQLIDLNENAYDICVCLPDLSQVPTPFLTKNIRFVEMQVLGIEKLPVGKLSLAAYNRLFLPQLFAQEYQYIVYLDADTFINRPFYQDLMQIITSFDPDFCIAAAVDVTEISRNIKSLQKVKLTTQYLDYYYQKNHFYRNSGGLVFHTKNCVAQDIGNTILTYAFSHIDALRLHDQSALNRALLNKIAILPFTYNWQMKKYTAPLTQEIQPYILHFITENKPWVLDNSCTHPYIPAYQAFFSQFFPNLAVYPPTREQQRKVNPKYTNPLRESISLFGQNLKRAFKSPDENTVTTTPAQLDQIRNLLKQQPFI